jgi:hypothetical protein
VGLWLPPGPDEGRHGVASDACFATLAALVVLVTAIALLRSDTRFAGAPKWFWMEKVAWGPSHDVVVAGDSRVYRGVDPSQFREGFVRGCVNYGFSSVTLTGQFVEAAAATLDPRGARILVLAITPASLRAPIPGKDGYLAARDEYARLRLPLGLARGLEEWQLHVAPFAVDRGFGEQVQASRATEDEYSQVFHSDGWVESDRQVADPVAAGIAVVRRDFQRSPYSREVEDGLVRAIDRLTSAGVRVFAYTPWVPPEVADAEAEASGIDFGRLRARLESARASWVELAPSALRSYDGTHLDGPSAKAASRSLAESVIRSARSATSGTRPGN